MNYIQGQDTKETPPHVKRDARIGAPSIRRWVQLGFALGAILTGIQFHRFVASLADGTRAYGVRPAEVDAWLPISSLMSLVYFIKTGIANSVHPAGLVLFTLILVLAVAMRRGFCSWVCPIGTLSEYTHQAGRVLFKRNFNIPKPIDITLRSIKYLLLAFFLIMIGGMSTAGMQAFIHGPYNRLADVKMYLLFTNLSHTALVVIVMLAVLSLLYKNFWCRYLCPYGALLGLASIASPVAVRRDPGACTQCLRCTQACPNRIAVHSQKSVHSPECTACYGCVTACQQPGALRMGLLRTKKPLTMVGYGLAIIAALLLVSQLFRACGYWETDTSHNEYRHLMPARAAGGS